MPARPQAISDKQQLFELFTMLGDRKLVFRGGEPVEQLNDQEFFEYLLEINKMSENEFYQLLERKDEAPPDELSGPKLYSYFLNYQSLLPTQPPRPAKPRPPAARTPMALVIEPRLKASPAKTLEEWNSRSEADIRLLQNEDVDYYIQSDQKLDRFEGILTFDRTVGDSKHPIYQYRLHGEQLTNAVNYGYIKNLPFTRFTPGRDPFSVIPEAARQKYGMGVAKVGDQHAVVVRSHNGSEQELLDLLRNAGLLWRSEKEREASNLHHAIEYQLDPDATRRLAVIHPIPAALAESMAQGHGQAHIPTHETSEALKQACIADATLFAPLAPPAPVEKAPTPAPAPEPSPLRDSTPDEVLAEALRLYEFELVGKRIASGEIRYRLKAARQPNWNNVPSDPATREKLSWHFSSVFDVARALGTAHKLNLNGSAQNSHMYFSVSPARTVAQEQKFFKTVANELGKSFAKVEIQPFQFQSSHVTRLEGSNGFRFPGANAKFAASNTPISSALHRIHEVRSREKVVHYYLMQEGETPMLVAVASKKQFSESAAKKLFTRFSLRPQNAELEIAPLLAKTDGTLGESTEQFAARIPIAPEIFADLKRHAKLPVLQARSQSKMMQELGVLSEQPAPNTPDAPLVRSVSVPPPPGKHVAETPEEKAAREDELLLETMRSIRGRMGHFYLAKIEEKDGVQPYAFMIVSPADNKMLHTRLRHQKGSNLDAQRVSSLRSFGRKKTATHLVQVALTPKVYARLAFEEVARAQQQPDYEDNFLCNYLSLPSPRRHNALPRLEAIASLTRWTEEEAADKEAQRNKRVTSAVALVPMLLAAARHTQGRILQVQMPGVDAIDAHIAQLQEEKTRQAARLGPSIDFRRDYEILSTHVAKLATLKPETQAAQAALSGTQQAARAAQEVIDNLATEITELQQLRAMVDKHGTTLPAIALRGAVSRFGRSMWEQVERAVPMPHSSAEGRNDHTEGRPMRALIGLHRIGLGRGKRGEQYAHLMLINPPLWESIEPELYERIQSETTRFATERRSNKLIDLQPLPYADVLDNLALHYEPNRHHQRKPNVSAAFRDMTHHALIANERVAETAKGQRVRSEDKGAQPTLYLVVNKSTRDKAVSLLTALAANDGIAAEKHYNLSEKRALISPTLSTLGHQLQELRDARRQASDTDDAFARATACFADLATDSPEKQFHAQRVLELLESPIEMLAGLQGEGRMAIRQHVVRPLMEMDESLSAPAIAWLKHVAEHNALPPDGATMKQVLDYLQAVPSLQHALKTAEFKLDMELQDYLAQHPDDAKTLNLASPTVGALSGEVLEVEEAVATRGSAEIRLMGPDGAATIPLAEPARLRNALRKQLKQATAKDGSVVLTCHLSPAVMEQLEPLRQEVPDRFQQLHVNERRNAPSDAAPLKAARFLDRIASGHQGMLPKEILQALHSFHGLAPLQEARSRA